MKLGAFSLQRKAKGSRKGSLKIQRLLKPKVRKKQLMLASLVLGKCKAES